MGRLINQERRRRAQAARHERMERIVAAGAHLFARQPFAEVTLDAIGQRAEVPHGTPSLYFGSREAVFLVVVAGEVRSWCEAVIAELDGLPLPVADEALAVLLGRSLAAREALSRLVSLLPVAIEHLPEEGAITTLTAALEGPLTEVAARLEERSASLVPGRGGEILRACFLAVVAAEPLATPRSGLALAFHDPQLDRWRVNLAEHVTGAVATELARRRV